MLGGSPRFDVDLGVVERSYKDLTKLLHPDRFARADTRARRASLQWSVRVNEAWRTLKDPVRRAEYLLAQAGIEVGGEQGTRRMGPGGKQESVPVPQALLVEVMELREGLMEARQARHEARVAELAIEVRDRREQALAAVARALAAEPRDLDAAAAELVAVRYWDRFLEEVAGHDDARAAGASHAG